MIQPVQCADGSVGDGHDGALQLEAEANAWEEVRDGRAAAARRGRGNSRARCWNAAPPCDVALTCVSEPPFFLCEAPAPESLGVSLSLWDSLLLDGLDEERRSRARGRGAFTPGAFASEAISPPTSSPPASA